MRRRITQDERGVVLAFTLGAVAFLGFVGLAVLNYAGTSYRATVALREQRSIAYAADAALEGAINKLRSDPEATCGNDFYKGRMPDGSAINGQPIVLHCTTVTPSPNLVVTFSARCPAGGTPACAAGVEVASARVRVPTSGPASVEYWGAG